MRVHHLFTEQHVWKGMEGTWKRVFGNYAQEGISVEWHDFHAEKSINWAKSFHPGSLEVCINLEGEAVFGRGKDKQFCLQGPTIAYYAAQEVAKRAAGNRHCFLTIEMSPIWLGSTLGKNAASCAREIRQFLADNPSPLPRFIPLNAWVRRAAEEMINPPLAKALQHIWYTAKILEISSHIFTDHPDELFCDRQKRVARERVEYVKKILKRDLENPPALSEIAREVGCSAYYLSRIFSEHTGMTMTRYLRTTRLERAAELLRTGKYNVTEAAMIVGYSSLSHFSKAFAEQFGECPCLFPFRGSSE